MNDLKIKKRYNLFALILVFFANISYAETIPVPSKRPAVMSVSQAYIDSLVARDSMAANEGSNKGELELNDIEPSASADSDFIFDDEGDYREIENIDAEDLLLSLSDNLSINNVEEIKHSGDAVEDRFIPIPNQKPVILASAENSDSIENSDEKALISFTLEPNQIDLNTNLKQFLDDYAINMFRSNQDLKMEIYAYATPDGNQEYSDVRKSLARALEVRRFLLSNNIQASRLKIIPIGLDPKNKTDNRIDLLFITTQ